jgi:hypothetical protein
MPARQDAFFFSSINRRVESLAGERTYRHHVSPSRRGSGPSYPNPPSVEGSIGFLGHFVHFAVRSVVRARPELSTRRLRTTELQASHRENDRRHNQHACSSHAFEYPSRRKRLPKSRAGVLLQRAQVSNQIRQFLPRQLRIQSLRHHRHIAPPKLLDLRPLKTLL